MLGMQRNNVLPAAIHPGTLGQKSGRSCPRQAGSISRAKQIPDHNGQSSLDSREFAGLRYQVPAIAGSTAGVERLYHR
jgi:hypothetical protein